MTTDEATARVIFSQLLVNLSEGETVTLDKRDLDWLASIHLLLPELKTSQFFGAA